MFIQSFSYIWPFEGNRKTDVASDENECDTLFMGWYNELTDKSCRWFFLITVREELTSVAAVKDPCGQK